jgi:hypothetical protein
MKKLSNLSKEIKKLALSDTVNIREIQSTMYNLIRLLSDTNSANPVAKKAQDNAENIKKLIALGIATENTAKQIQNFDRKLAVILDNVGKALQGRN